MKNKLIIAILSAVALVAIMVGTIALASRGAIDAIERQRHDIIGLAIDVGDYGVNLFSASLVLKDIKIYPAGKEDDEHILAKADALRVALSPRDLLVKTIHARKIVLVNPKINVIKETKTNFNWDALDLGADEEKAKTEADEDKADEWEVRIDSVKIRDGEIAYVDKSEGHRLRLTKLNMQVSDIRPNDNPDELPTQLNIDAKIDDNKGMLNVRGRLNLFAEGVNFKLRSIIGNSPITYYRSFYAGSTPFPIVGGTISITSQATSKKSELLANNHATIYNLRAGGGIKGDLINAFVLKKRAPVEADVTVKGNIEKGDFDVGSKISAGIGDGILAQAKAIPDLLSPAEKIMSKTKSIGEGVKGLFKR